MIRMDHPIAVSLAIDHDTMDLSRRTVLVSSIVMGAAWLTVPWNSLSQAPPKSPRELTLAEADLYAPHHLAG
ncbi:MAG: hypothetical protein H7839_19910 [Magnetococcus sp. YQC-5]